MSDVAAPPRRPLGRVLITGAGGFLGRAALQALRARGEDVETSDCSRHGDDSDNLVLCDVSRFQEVDALVAEARADTILHCGAVSGPMVMTEYPDLIWRINCQGAANILEAARRHGTGRVVLCSTTDVYGTTRRGILDESAPLEPLTVYAGSKAAAEQALLGYAREHGVDGVAVRLSWIYGPGRTTPTLLDHLLRNAVSGRKTVLDAHPSEVTHYLFISDAVGGLLAAACAERPTGRIFNIAAEQGLTLGEMVDQARVALPGLKVEFRGNPSGGGPGAFDGRRAATDLGFHAEVPLKEGLRRCVKALCARAR